MFYFFGPNIHPPKLTWNLKRMVSKRNLLFQGSIFRFHVSFRGSINQCVFEGFGLVVLEIVQDFFEGMVPFMEGKGAGF